MAKDGFISRLKLFKAMDPLPTGKIVHPLFAHQTSKGHDFPMIAYYLHKKSITIAKQSPIMTSKELEKTPLAQRCSLSD